MKMNQKVWFGRFEQNKKTILIFLKKKIPIYAIATYIGNMYGVHNKDIISGTLSKYLRRWLKRKNEKLNQSIVNKGFQKTKRTITHETLQKIFKSSVKRIQLFLRNIDVIEKYERLYSEYKMYSEWIFDASGATKGVHKHKSYVKLNGKYYTFVSALNLYTKEFYILIHEGKERKDMFIEMIETLNIRNTIVRIDKDFLLQHLKGRFAKLLWKRNIILEGLKENMPTWHQNRWVERTFSWIKSTLRNMQIKTVDFLVSRIANTALMNEKREWILKGVFLRFSNKTIDATTYEQLSMLVQESTKKFMDDVLKHPRLLKRNLTNMKKDKKIKSEYDKLIRILEKEIEEEEEKEEEERNFNEVTKKSETPLPNPFVQN